MSQVLFDVPVDNGKYRFVMRLDEDGVKVLHHDNEWTTLTRANKAVIAMACELEAARERIAELKDKLDIESHWSARPDED